jgi:hypothetical protein
MTATASKSVTTLEDVRAQNAAPAKSEAEVEAEILSAKFDDTLSGKRAIVTVHSEKSEGGNHAVFASLNGYAYQIPRDKAWNVPMELVEVLENANQTYYEHEVQDGRTVPVQRNTPRLAFSVRPAADLSREEAQAVASKVARGTRA